MNDEAVRAILANELDEGGPMSAFIVRSGAKPVDRTSYHLDSLQRAALLKGLRTTGKYSL
jgi:hypothetical protein